jgi:hypothetical protein
LRKDGFSGPIKLGLEEPPEGFTSPPVTLPGNQLMARLPVRTTLADTQQPVDLTVAGSAKIRQQDVAHPAVPAEDRMQAFLWRQLVPAEDLKVQVFDPAYVPPPKRVPRARPPTPPEPQPPSVPEGKPPAGPADPKTEKPKFNKQQVAGRLRQLKILFEEGLLTDDFYERKVAECETAQ